MAEDLFILIGQLLEFTKFMRKPYNENDMQIIEHKIEIIDNTPIDIVKMTHDGVLSLPPLSQNSQQIVQNSDDSIMFWENK